MRAEGHSIFDWVRALVAGMVHERRGTYDSTAPPADGQGTRAFQCWWRSANFEAKAGTTITYNVGRSGTPDGSEYSLYSTLERLQ